MEGIQPLSHPLGVGDPQPRRQPPTPAASAGGSVASAPSGAREHRPHCLSSRGIRGGAGAAVIHGRGDVNHSPRSPGRMRPRAPSLPHASHGPQALSSAGWKRLAARGGMGWGHCSSWDAGAHFPAPASGWDEGAAGCGCLLHPGSLRGSSPRLGCVLISAPVVKNSWRFPLQTVLEGELPSSGYQIPVKTFALGPSPCCCSSTLRAVDREFLSCSCGLGWQPPPGAARCGQRNLELRVGVGTEGDAAR